MTEIIIIIIKKKKHKNYERDLATGTSLVEQTAQYNLVLILWEIGMKQKNKWASNCHSKTGPAQ